VRNEKLAKISYRFIAWIVVVLFIQSALGMIKDDLWPRRTVEYGNLLKLKHNKSAGDIV